MLVYGTYECFVMHMLYVCVLCPSQYCILRDLQFAHLLGLIVISRISPNHKVFPASICLSSITLFIIIISIIWLLRAWKL